MWHQWHFGLDNSVWWGCPVDCKMLAASLASPHFVTARNVFRHCHMSLQRQNLSQLRTTAVTKTQDTIASCEVLLLILLLGRLF